MTQAIIIGGSMAGLMAARVLSQHFDNVMVIERDALPEDADYRAGVPQARHGHALLAEGRRVMESYFPGLVADLAEVGAPELIFGQNAFSYTNGTWTKQYDSGIVTNAVSRVSLEWLIRRRVNALNNVRFLTQMDVEQLTTDANNQTVTGVIVKSRQTHQSETLNADLIVDTSGRGSHAPEWLTALGYDAPEEMTISSKLGYATRWYEVPEDKRGDWKLLMINSVPNEGLYRGGGIFEVEENHWIVTLAGMNEDYPPTDEDGFLEFAASLASPAIYNAIKNATPISQVYGYRRTANRLRHYEKLRRRPENFILMGDSVCAFNPIYGQGMTVAALEAAELDTMLANYDAHNLKGFAGAFQKKVAQTVKTTWMMATGEDLRYPATTGKKPGLMDRMTQKYMDAAIATLTDEVVLQAFLEVVNLLKPPTALFSPYVMWRILKRKLIGKTGNEMTRTQELQVVPQA